MQIWLVRLLRIELGGESHLRCTRRDEAITSIHAIPSCSGRNRAVNTYSTVINKPKTCVRMLTIFMAGWIKPRIKTTLEISMLRPLSAYTLKNENTGMTYRNM